MASPVHDDAADPTVRVDGVISRGWCRVPSPLHPAHHVADYPAAPIALPGLDAQATYRVRPLALNMASGEPFGEIGNGQSELGWWNANGVEMTGEALASYGLRPPSIHPANAVLFQRDARVARHCGRAFAS